MLSPIEGSSNTPQITPIISPLVERRLSNSSMEFLKSSSSTSLVNPRAGLGLSLTGVSSTCSPRPKRTISGNMDKGINAINNITSAEVDIEQPRLRSIQSKNNIIMDNSCGSSSGSSKNKNNSVGGTGVAAAMISIKISNPTGEDSSDGLLIESPPCQEAQQQLDLRLSGVGSGKNHADAAALAVRQDTHAAEIALLQAPERAQVYYLLMALNFTTRGCIAIYETQSSRIFLDQFHMSFLQLGALVSCSGEKQ